MMPFETEGPPPNFAALLMRREETTPKLLLPIESGESQLQLRPAIHISRVTELRPMCCHQSRHWQVVFGDAVSCPKCLEIWNAAVRLKEIL